jgi:hypothetical protein
MSCRLLKSIVTGALSVIAWTASTQVALASPSYIQWRENGDGGHYLLYDFAARLWVETINCRPAFYFTETSNADGELQLYDASRGMHVAILDGAMWLWPQGATSWSRYKEGFLDARTTYYEEDGGGGIVGTFTRRHGCVWEERFGGTATPDFSFYETTTDSGEVVMYDGSRDIYVRLRQGQMELRQGASGAFQFFRAGHWSY